MALRLLIAATTSVSEKQLSVPPPPYERYVLENVLFLPWNNIPASMRGAISDDSWQEFWTKIQPIVRDVEEFNQNRFRWIILRIMLVITLSAVMGSHVDVGAHNGFFLLFLALVVSRRKLNTWMLENQQKQLEALRQECQRAEETIFRRHGWTIDCDYIWHNIKSYYTGRLPYSLNLYFVPIANRSTLDAVDTSSDISHQGFLRIQHFHSGRVCGGSVAANRDAYSALPPALLADDTDVLWTNFWSELIRRQARRTQWIRATIVIYLVFLFWFILGFPLLVISEPTAGVDVNGNDATMANLYLSVTAALLLVVIGLSRKLNTLEAGIRDFVNETSIELAQLGLYLETRSVWEQSSLYLKGDYLYLFPVVQSTTAMKAAVCLPLVGESSSIV